MKTRQEIETEVAQSCAEEHFEVILDAEIMCGDYETARRLLVNVANRYVNQYIDNSDKERVLLSLNPVILAALQETSALFDKLIERTPTGELRNQLCDANIKVKTIIDQAL